MELRSDFREFGVEQTSSLLLKLKLDCMVCGKTRNAETPHAECADGYARLEAEYEAEEKARRFKSFNEQEEREFQNQCSPPKDWREKTFNKIHETPGNKTAIQIANSWNSSDPFGLLFIGPCGSGKTHLAWAVVNKIINSCEKENVQVTYPRVISVAELFHWVRKNDFKIPSFLDNGWIVALDDLGSENTTEWSREIFLMILDRIQKSKTRLILTTNLSLKELREKLHERITSRILELCVPVKVDGDDYRLKRTKEFGAELASRLSK